MSDLRGECLKAAVMFVYHLGGQTQYEEKQVVIDGISNV